jgi:hypothetical protein
MEIAITQRDDTRRFDIDQLASGATTIVCYYWENKHRNHVKLGANEMCPRTVVIALEA